LRSSASHGQLWSRAQLASSEAAAGALCEQVPPVGQSIEYRGTF